MNWKRIIKWSLLIIFVVNSISFVLGFATTYWEMYAENYEQSVFYSRLVRRVIVALVAIFLYWRFVAGAVQSKFLHVLALFLIIQVLDLLVTLAIIQLTGKELFSFWGLVRGFIYALLGYGIAGLNPRSTAALTRSKSSEL